MKAGKKGGREVEKGGKLLEMLAANYRHQLPFFKRVLIYVIANHWSSGTKKIFWMMEGNTASLHIFSGYYYQREIYYLLQKNISLFTRYERKNLNEIFDKGPQDNLEGDQDYPNNWRLKWLTALREDERHKERYEKLSEELNVSEDRFEQTSEARVTISFSSESPISQKNFQGWKLPIFPGTFLNLGQKTVLENPP
ncbi:MAG: hypothetical protein OEX02_15615 [Cyclobacteriaceae bacterium]|nr:hypothetical protein [Cyclobacteriaceae bacterium]